MTGPKLPALAELRMHPAMVEALREEGKPVAYMTDNGNVGKIEVTSVVASDAVPLFEWRLVDQTTGQTIRGGLLEAT